ncbi:hypothetical protein AUEXF2481DRAFT_91229 [Aureobasidium subglaciale EXF-2481]|uniref:Uncharacterized protein n=1 Tax=Aureobasidium subglaciale (strain EXF-2481) TaxID=1043005 RepID=A0A074Y3X2_AURSE|nr:uncharacterized protein AUEXF2481DRAFT_91229 [Aureobasidium subglaciale EXF-2481]KAI5210861.1 hypothetical protein E4T38_01785 [Aureobasidium subglaciale]KAI5229318.1 hypothetical protein E4T40_01695 [Aureobasidium subglaciale]KAI5232846.1 hypothetical protein E4T41_01783 [Aureobasidium subglaciale]KAI5266278.1 hypothetical protein E4T46_01692 [Aureobasidium subglaciale]KEQ92493.1 hypothetical protein AUEXF2481DRAFT_91229 [Aureobasidium subglaciale EXF-2481]
MASISSTISTTENASSTAIASTNPVLTSAHDFIIAEDAKTAADVVNIPSVTGSREDTTTTRNVAFVSPITREQMLTAAAANLDAMLANKNTDEQIRILKNNYLRLGGQCHELNRRHHEVATWRRDVVAKLDSNRALVLKQLNVEDQRIGALEVRESGSMRWNASPTADGAALTTRLVNQANIDPYADRINTWVSQGQVERIVLRPEGQTRRAATRVIRSTASHSSKRAMLVQRQSAQTVNGRPAVTREHGAADYR